ncbi:hypothetical protein KDA11_05610 [Candidatus Saccharibacteria bacterium]|nr:hypothetical protein [Candidatus Saccharibacteria bacterium]
MTTIYAEPNSQTLKRWNNDETFVQQVKVGDPLTVEMRRLNINSRKFDRFGSSELMIAAYTRSLHTKEASMASIIYHDSKVEPVKKAPFIKSGKFSVGPFDASQYGNPVIYHTPGYVGNTINITIKLWEIDNPSKVKKVFDLLDYGTALVAPFVSLASPAAAPYFNMTSSALGLSSRIICGTIDHDLLAPEHTVELRLDSSQPLRPGKYICLPEVTDLTEKYEILQKYVLVENRLVQERFDDGEQKWYYDEYPRTYFVLKVSVSPRDDLADFDFTASAAELLTLLNSGTNTSDTVVENVLQMTKKAHTMGVIEDFLGEDDIQRAQAILKHLPASLAKQFAGVASSAVQVPHQT